MIEEGAGSETDSDGVVRRMEIYADLLGLLVRREWA